MLKQHGTWRWWCTGQVVKLKLGFQLFTIKIKINNGLKLLRKQFCCHSMQFNSN